MFKELNERAQEFYRQGYNAQVNVDLCTDTVTMIVQGRTFTFTNDGKGKRSALNANCLKALNHLNAAEQFMTADADLAAMRAPAEPAPPKAEPAEPAEPVQQRLDGEQPEPVAAGNVLKRRGR